MTCDMICTGVGGQGVLSVAAIIARSALREGLHVKQSEEHGMAQRGGSVVTHLRLSDEPIHSDLVPRGKADLIVSMEPVESLRHAAYLSPDGAVVTAAEPVTNVPGYPDPDVVRSSIRRLPRACLIEATALAREAGSAVANNMVMVGAASDLLPLAAETIESCIREAFGSKGQKVVQTNIEAFRAGRKAAR